MARGFSIQDIACVTLEGSTHGVSAPTPTSVTASAFSSATASASASIATSTSTTGRQGQCQQSRCSFRQQMQHRDRDGGESDNICDSGGGGLIASSFNWFDKQREKRRREHLKQEAEKQLQKIGEAQRAALREAGSIENSVNSTGTNVTTTVNRNHSLADSSSSSSSQQDSTGGIDLVLVANQSLVSGSSVADSDGEAIAIHNTANTETSRQQQFITQTSSSFGTSDVSKSGEGASGMIDLSDIGGLCGEGRVTNEYRKTDGAQTKNKDKEEKNHNDNDDDIIPPVRVTQVEADESSPYILSQNQMNEIASHVLPETITYCRWRRLYGLGRDGDSFDGCLRIIGSVKRTLMVVRTTKGDIFGGYADAPWHSRGSSSTAKFYGTASSCLYSFSSTRTPMSSSSSPELSPINVYRWTGKNRYIQVCDVSNKMLAFGGGGDKGAFGLCLQEDFQRGTTGHCDTFDNDPLCSGYERTFDIVDVEFWEFLTGIF